MTISAIQDAIKALAQTLNVATIFPATLFVLVHVYWILPQSGLKLIFSPFRRLLTACQSQ